MGREKRLSRTNNDRTAKTKRVHLRAPLFVMWSDGRESVRERRRCLALALPRLRLFEGHLDRLTTVSGFLW